MKKLILCLFIVILIIGIVFLFKNFTKNPAKNLKIGNNTTSQEIVDNILNVSSYKASIEVEVNSNKNSNKYKIKQEYKNSDESTQEVVEPSNIAGMKITKKGKSLKLENTNLQLSSIYENYECLSDNCLDLISFIKDYKEDDNSSWEENNNKIIMKCNCNGKNEKLEVDSKTGMPINLEIKHVNQKTSIYILYTEVSLNS